MRRSSWIMILVRALMHGDVCAENRVTIRYSRVPLRPAPIWVMPTSLDARECLRDRLCDANHRELIALTGGAVPAPCTFRQLTGFSATLSKVVVEVCTVANANGAACVVGALADEGPLTPVVECACLFSKLMRFLPLDPTFPTSRLLYQLRLIYIYIDERLCIYACMHACMHVYTHVCMYACM